MNKWVIFFILAVVSIPSSPFCDVDPSKTYYILRYPNPNSGLFSAFRFILSALFAYEKNKDKISGLEIDFAEQGIYYDPNHGSNSWEYYCEPIRLGSSKHAKIVTEDNLYSLCPVWFHENRKANANIISKYIRVKPHIIHKVDEIVQSKFGGFMLGIHYRGTDKDTEAFRVEYKKVLEIINSLNLKNFKIFVATDESSFLEFMKQHFPGQIVYYEGAYRSVDGRPVHTNKELSPYKKGEDAFIDCLLLSKCNFLIATCSHLSQCSSFFNSSLPVLILNHYYQGVKS